MIFSKSFGYALRGVLYVAMMHDENRNIQVDEIAKRLSVPRYFLGKIMNKVARSGILNSTKGPNGGFALNNATLTTSLVSLLESTNGLDQFSECTLRLRKCNASDPCPMHDRIKTYKADLLSLLSQTEIGSLLKEDKVDFIRMISVA
jgi:Rrf2 family protein